MPKTETLPDRKRKEECSRPLRGLSPSWPQAPARWRPRSRLLSAPREHPDGRPSSGGRRAKLKPPPSPFPLPPRRKGNLLDSFQELCDRARISARRDRDKPGSLRAGRKAVAIATTENPGPARASPTPPGASPPRRTRHARPKGRRDEALQRETRRGGRPARKERGTASAQGDSPVGSSETFLRNRPHAQTHQHRGGNSARPPLRCGTCSPERRSPLGKKEGKSSRLERLPPSKKEGDHPFRHSAAISFQPITITITIRSAIIAEHPHSPRCIAA